MDKQIRTENDKYYLARITNRTERLVRLLELEAPRTIIANECYLVFKAAIGLDPSSVGRMILGWITPVLRNDRGQCAGFSGSPECENEIEERPPHHCPACIAELEAEFGSDRGPTN